MRNFPALALMLLLALAAPAQTVFTTLRGIVHDSQHRPIAGASVTVQALDSAFSLHAATNADGAFSFPDVPIGAYRLNVKADGFVPASQTITLVTGAHPILHIPLAVAASTESVVVTASAASAASQSVTTTTLISREDIETTPGADRTLGIEMITDYVPGAYMTHDMLHMRGGHQTSWLIDGVNIPNTKIASNLGPQIDPKDIDQLETQRGSYTSEVGDRTYGVFDVLPRNGFEFNHDAELTVRAGNLYAGEVQLALGDHSTRTAWYASVTGSRANYGLATPVPQILHDATNSGSGFVSIIRNQTANDQVRLDAQYRQDFFQIPYDPYPNDWEQASQYYESYGLRDTQTERDSFVIANWVHSFSPRATSSFAPFYHLNQADYDSPASDYPAATTWHQSSNYVGGQWDARLEKGPNSISTGAYTFYQKENDLYGVVVNDGSAPSEPDTRSQTGAALFEYYLSDHLRLGPWVTLLGGERFSVYRAGLDETAIYPRIGATVEIPRLHWVLRGFYGHFFQPAPVETVSSSVLNYAGNVSGENTFTALPSERDEEHQFGIDIPYRGWTLDIDTFKNRVNNFLDHSNLGESNLYFPIAVDGALVRAWEMALRSPAVGRMGQFHLAYSNQIAEQRGNIIGGFTCSDPTDPACDLGPSYFPVDHDQRHTLNAGFTANLPNHIWFSSNVYYGSGFTNGLAGSGLGPYQGNNLPAHTTLDSAIGHTFGERLRVTAGAINVTNHRVLLDNSVTVGGFHFNDPRMFYGEVRYRFRF
ncbi:MAG TPA: TonB-dependent receptor [Terracidiphilus sp.]|jgi:outer membrane receptor for ferrienterochelin and colicin|nr:TonB-dependent receptor [Terracidiphilus sp.]